MESSLAALNGFPDAGRVLARAFSRGLRPPRRRRVSQWAEDERFVSRESGSSLPGKWSNSVAPEMVEVMDCLTPAIPGRTVTLKKSAQLSGSESGINLFGHVVVDDPGPMMIVLPTTDEVKKYVRVKLQPAIDSTKTLKARVREQKSRDEDSSTTTFKKFDGGFLQLVGANSSSGLQMVSIRVLILEEVSEYPFDVDGRGDPVEMAIERTQAWEGREKIFFCSTPGLDGVCRVSQKYEISDQRRRYLPCPHCGTYQTAAMEAAGQGSGRPGLYLRPGLCDRTQQQDLDAPARRLAEVLSGRRLPAGGGAAGRHGTSPGAAVQWP
jgi:phage terminase large subunit GpA-like protein